MSEPTHPEHPRQPERPEQSERPEQPEPPQQPERPARSRLSQVSDPVVRSRLGLFATLLVACFVTSWFPLPWSLVTLVFAGWALVIGIMTLRRVLRTKDRGIVIPLLVVGVFSATMLVVSTGTTALVWPVQRAWQECRAGAVTVEATEQCDRQQRQDLEAHLRGLLGLSPPGATD